MDGEKQTLDNVIPNVQPYDRTKVLTLFIKINFHNVAWQYKQSNFYNISKIDSISRYSNDEAIVSLTNWCHTPLGVENCWESKEALLILLDKNLHEVRGLEEGGRGGIIMSGH